VACLTFFLKECRFVCIPYLKTTPTFLNIIIFSNKDKEKEKEISPTM